MDLKLNCFLCKNSHEMKLKILIALSCLFPLLVACSNSGTTATPEPTQQSGGTAAPTAEPASDGIKVADDGVVRNAEGKAYCVVMKKVVEGAEADYPSQTVDGVKYIFCCESCPRMFAKDPSKYTIAKN